MKNNTKYSYHTLTFLQDIVQWEYAMLINVCSYGEEY